MKTNKRNAFFVILASALFLVDVILLIVFTATSFFSDKPVLEALLIGLLVLSAAMLATSLFLYLNQSALLKTLQIENAYVLGQKSIFNNIYIFQKRVITASKLRRRQKKHIVAFTISNLVVSQNFNRNMEIFSLNGHIVNYLNDLHKVVNARSGDFIFAYSRGIFLIYAFRQNEVSLKKIVEALSAEIYDYASKECPHIWVQPFFGVAVVDKEETVAQQIEDATIARDYSLTPCSS